MPHLILEYSANLEARLDVQALVDGLHQAAAGVEGLPLGGLRTRAARREAVRVADGDPENAFVHVVLRLGHGRSLERRRVFGDALFSALCGLLEPVYTASPLAISMEIQEIHPQLTWKQNNLRDHMARRGVAEDQRVAAEPSKDAPADGSA